MEDYALLVESLKSVGYSQGFSLKDTNSAEENLRRLWLKESSFSDAQKNVALLILLKNFDFIAEGLQSKASPDDPYYRDWPRAPSMLLHQKQPPSAMRRCCGL